MRIEDVPLADIMFHVEVIEDRRKQDGYLLVRCPNDDGSDDHALHVCNPRYGLPSTAYCLSPKCRGITTIEMIELHDRSLGKSPN